MTVLISELLAYILLLRIKNSYESTILKPKSNPDMDIVSINDNFPTTNDFVSVLNLTDILKILLPLPEASITSVQHAATFFPV